MEKRLNVNDLKSSLKIQELKLQNEQGEEVVLKCEPVGLLEQEVIVNTILTQFDSYSFDAKVKALKILYLEQFTDLDPYHTLDEKNLVKAIDLIPSYLFWQLESVGFYAELERNFKQEHALKREYENSSSFGAQLIIMFLTDVLKTLADIQGSKAIEASNEAQSLLQTLNEDLQSGKYENVVSLVEKMESNRQSVIKED